MCCSQPNWGGDRALVVCTLIHPGLQRGSCKGVGFRTLLSWPVHPFRLTPPSQMETSGKLLEAAVTNGIFLLLLFKTSSSKTPSSCSLLAQAT